MAVGGGQDLGRSVLGQQEVDDVQEALEVAILEVVADGDEDCGHSGSNPDGVLNVEILMMKSVQLSVLESSSNYGFDTSVFRGLRVGSTVKGLQREGGARRDVRAELTQEGLKFSISGGDFRCSLLSLP